MASGGHERNPLLGQSGRGAQKEWLSPRRFSPFISRISMVMLFSFIALIVLRTLSHGLLAGTSHQTSLERREIAAIGFDVTESIATASIRTPSGSIVRLARYHGTSKYQDRMKRLGLDSSRHMAPPYEYWHDGGVLLGWNDFPRQLARRARKAVGLAASEDVRIIGSMLATLKDGAERELAKHTSEFPWVPIDKLKITHAVVSSNDFVALYDEDIRDAAAYANLELLRDAFFTRQPRHAHAAFAGYGLNDNLKQGHVRNATSSESGVSKKNVVAAYLSHSALELSCETKWTNRTCPQAWAQHLDYFSPSLGWPLDGVDDDVEGIIAQSKWGEGVKDLVRRCVRNEIQNHYVNRDDMNVTDVLMLGEKGGPGVFGSMVKEVLEELQSKEPRWHGLVENGGVDRGEAEWKASEGAAQIAWRVLYEPLDAHGDNSECIIEQARKLSPASLIKY